MDGTTENPLFSETQQFRATWFWTIILLLLLLPVVCFLSGFFFQPEEEMPLAPYIFTACFLLIGFLIFSMKLETKIFSSGISYRYKPFHRKFRTIAMNEISEIYVRKYSPIGEYGGYGLKFTFGDGWALNISGNTGIQIEMKNGKKILIGTLKPEEAERILQSIRCSRS